jgi:hypothetical protein
MLVDVLQFRTYSILKHQIYLIASAEINLINSKPCFQISYQVTIYLICSHKVYLLGARDTCN